jgi:hypothetical protein
MNGKSMMAIGIATLAGLCMGAVYAQTHDKYDLVVPGGLAFSEFRGYESWQTIGVSRQADETLAVILGNPAMLEALQAGIPGNGRPFPNGAKMAKVHYAQMKLATFPTTAVSGTQRDVLFMVKDSARFPDGGGWGYAAFTFDAASSRFAPLMAPRQANDAKCGVACHTLAQARDYVFSEYTMR